jgi:hypothetical protein
MFCTRMVCNPYLVEAAAFPFLYATAMVTGALMGMWNKRKAVADLEERIDNLEWDLSVANRKLESATSELRSVIKGLTPEDSDADSESESEPEES